MATEILLPKLGLTMTEGTINDLLVADGTQINTGDAIMTVGTDKVDVDIEAEASGLFHAAVSEGVTLPPGALLGWLLEPGEAVPEGGASTSADSPEVAAEPATPGPTASGGAPATSGPAPGGRAFISPNARRVAAELGVDLATVRGTGPSGRIVSEDVEEAAAAIPSTPVPTAPIPAAAGTAGPMDLHPPLRTLASDLGVDVTAIRPTGPGGTIVRSDVLAAASGAGAGAVVSGDNPVTQVVPLTGMRGAIASRMHASLQESAQLTHGYHVSLDAVIDVRARLKEESAGTDVTVPSLNDFVVKAVALALREHPGMNATIVDGEIRQLQHIHLGLAVAVPNGLYVPVIRHADHLTLGEIARQTRSLAGAARAGKLSLAQLEGGTFAVSSLGTYGVDMFTPVINPGNVGILGVGQVRDGVRWEGDRPLRTQEVTLSLTFDHRAVDGAPAAEFLRTVDALLDRPLRLLAG